MNHQHVHSSAIVGWHSPDATLCGPCGWESYHDDDTGSMLDARDLSGNPVSPIRAGDEFSDNVECDDCGTLIAVGTARDPFDSIPLILCPETLHSWSN